MTEAAWQAMVVELAGYCGWRHFHPYDMRRSDPGWPDMVLVRRGPVAPVAELVFAELKTDRGRLTREQVEWGELLTAVAAIAPNVDYYVWRPRDFEIVHARLQRRA